MNKIKDKCDIWLVIYYVDKFNPQYVHYDYEIHWFMFFTHLFRNTIDVYLKDCWSFLINRIILIVTFNSLSLVNKTTLQ